jgi:hypothetical protein
MNPIDEQVPSIRAPDRFPALPQNSNELLYRNAMSQKVLNKIQPIKIMESTAQNENQHRG